MPYKNIVLIRTFLNARSIYVGVTETSVLVVDPDSYDPGSF